MPLHSKYLLLVLICLNHIYDSTSIRYMSTETHDIHVFSHISLFLPYVQLLLKARNLDSTVTVVLIHKDLTVTLENLKLLSSIGPSENPEVTITRSSTDHTSSGGSKSPIGDNNTPSKTPIMKEIGDGRLDFALFLINDCSSETKTSILSPKSVLLQQLLRFFAIKHEAAFASVSGLESVLRDPESLVEFLSGIFEGSEQPVLDFASLMDSTEPGTLAVHQQIPPSWDSYSKILLVAKSLPHLPLGSCLREDGQLDELNDLYNHWLSSPEPETEDFNSFMQKLGVAKSKKDNLPPQQELKPLTFNDIVRMIKNRFSS